MADIWQVQDIFWSSFGIPAYDDQTVDVEISYPHLTYEAFDGVLDQTTSLSVNLWYRTVSWAGIKQKAEEIRKALISGELLKYDDGYVWIKLSNSEAFARPFGSGVEDDLIKRILITVEAEALSA